MKIEGEYRKTGEIPSIIVITINMLNKPQKDMEEIGEVERVTSICKVVNNK